MIKPVKPIVIELEVEDILVFITVIETFRMMCDATELNPPFAVKLRITSMLEKMMLELEKQEVYR